MKNNSTRMPAVSGQFYPSSKNELNKIIAGFKPDNIKKQDAIACMMPHAGYVYSGSVAVETAASINIKENIVLLGPNHTGYGADFSIMTDGEWATPLGNVKINRELGQKIIQHCDFLKVDPLAHSFEHSLEVELPILQNFKDKFEIVPITVLSGDIQLLKKLGAGIATAIHELKLESLVTIVASSDMTHYEPQKDAEKKDKQAIEAILGLDEDRLIKNVIDLNITMCGFAPVVSMIVAAKALGAKKAQLVKYRTSGDVTGDKTSVVGYAGIVVS